MRSHKITKKSGEAEKRRYDDACGTAHALELLGDRWALLILRELMLGGRRFSQLRADLPGLSANVLTQRLGELESRGLLLHRTLPPPASVPVYELTPWGYETEPITQAMGRWAARSPHHDASLRISGVSLLLSFRTMLDRQRAKGIDAEVGFRFGDDVYRGHLTPSLFAISQGDPDDAQLVFIGSPMALGAAVHGGVPISKLEKAGALTVIGERKLAQRFTTLFPLPEKLPT
jgi:DNA-binding HxlR family transcriptional regulator